MKYITSISIAATLTAGNAWAVDTAPYFESDQKLTTSIDADNNFGPFPSAINEAGDMIAAYASKAQIAQDTDIGLPYTFNQRCIYDDTLCEQRFYGSENESDLSFENAYQDWRNAISDIDNGATPESYFLADVSGTAAIGYGDATDVKVTDVVDALYIGYGSAPYASGEREFVRRGFVSDSTGSIVSSLLPEFDTYGGFTSAYKMHDVIYSNGVAKTLIIGNTSKSLAGGDEVYFNRCYSSDETDYRYTLNDLIYCPGFDTQAWAWEYPLPADELTGFTLATQWLDNNETANSDATYSAAAFDINSAGIAVGVSTFEYYDDDDGARQRAIIMTPIINGEFVTYGAPTELTAATSGLSEQEDSIYNTWAITISEDISEDASGEYLVMGNREYAYDYAKGRNVPIEMFIYNTKTEEITFPFLDQKVLSTKQRLNNESGTKSGANSYGYDMNNNGLVVGKADAYNQTNPVVDGSPRAQSAFLYDNLTGQSWFLDDLLCTEIDGVITHPLIRLQSATAINDAGVILAEGYEYANINNYKYWIDPIPVMLKLTPPDAALNITPDDSPNCWESEALIVADEPYERSGAASFWLWLLALPLLLVRKFLK